MELLIGFLLGCPTGIVIYKAVHLLLRGTKRVHDTLDGADGRYPYRVRDPDALSGGVEFFVRGQWWYGSSTVWRGCDSYARGDYFVTEVNARYSYLVSLGDGYEALDKEFYQVTL